MDRETIFDIIIAIIICFGMTCCTALCWHSMDVRKDNSCIEKLKEK